MSGTQSPSFMDRRREELYGVSRLKNVDALKKNLTTDHIAMISKEGTKNELPSWQSNFKMNFKGTQPCRQEEQSSNSERQRFYQDNSHFDFRGDAGPIDDAIYHASLTTQDYQYRTTKPLPPVRPDGNVNLPDMNSRYWRDNEMGSSLYATDFSDNKEVRHGVEVPEIVKARNDMRRRNVEDLRTTHFRFGNDPLSFNTETGFCYKGKKPLPAVGTTETETAAELTQKMIEQERDSAIFREGDYNVTHPKPGSTTFSRDYDATNKPYKSAAFVEPTRTQKGRFLVDSPFKNYVEQEAARYPGLPPSTETKTADSLAICSALKQLFMQYDSKRSGFISKPQLKRVCNSLLHPITPTDLEHILEHTSRGKDGEIDYKSFIDQFVDLQIKTQPTNNTDLNGNQIPKEDENNGSIPSTASSKQSETPLDTAKLGKEYQTSVHFKFGNDADKISTIYNKDFQQAKDQRQLSARRKPPPPSEVIHKLPGVDIEASTKQSDFINFKEVSPGAFQDSIAARDQASLKNKRRHAINNVVFAGDKEKEAQDRQKSLSHLSYVSHKTDGHSYIVTAPTSRYNYLHGDGALPYPPNIPQYSETTEAFVSAKGLAIESNEELHAFKSENDERSKDGKRAHFLLGNDDPGHVSEAMDCFKTHAQKSIEAAGNANQDDPNFPHHQVSKNTQDLSRDPMVPSTFQAQRMIKKSYYNSVPNPTDPLHIKLRGRLMDIDMEKRGRLDKMTLRDVCKEFHLSISEYAMDKLLQRCESDFGDQTVDYHKFVRNLTLEQVPNDVSAAHSSSTMMKDYRPIGQRSFTNAQLLTMQQMDKKPVEPMPTHFFHVDGSGENHFQSLTTQDYLKPELQA